MDMMLFLKRVFSKLVPFDTIRVIFLGTPGAVSSEILASSSGFASTCSTIITVKSWSVNLLTFFSSDTKGNPLMRSDSFHVKLQLSKEEISWMFEEEE